MAIEKYVIFRLDKVLFGIHISLVSEIINPLRIFRVPDAPDSVTGLISVRGLLHTVLNLRPVFNLDTCESAKSRMLLIHRGGGNECHGNKDQDNEISGDACQNNGISGDACQDNGSIDNESPGDENRAVDNRADEYPIGIIVDEVLEIAEIGESDRAEIPANYCLDIDTMHKHLQGAAQSKDRFILLLNGLHFLDY